MERVTAHERQVASEARAMTRLEVIGKALSGSINWIEAAVVLGVTARHMRRLRLQYEIFGKEGLLDGRRGLPRRRRVSDATISEVLRLRRELYADFSIRHLHEHLVERHGIGVSYNPSKLVLRGGIEPPTRGFSVRTIEWPSPREARRKRSVTAPSHR